MVVIASVAVRAVSLLFIYSFFFHEIAPELHFGKAGDYFFCSFKVKVKNEG